MTEMATPPTAYAVVTQQINDLESAHNDAQTGNKAAIQLVYIRSRQLDVSMRSLRDYATVATDGNGALIVEAGFDLVRLPSPVGELPAPANGRVMATDKDGQAVIRWNRVRGASSYVVEYRLEAEPVRPAPLPGEGDEPTNRAGNELWKAGALTQSANATIVGLRSATYYLVRVAANGASGLSGWSDLIRVLVK